MDFSFFLTKWQSSDNQTPHCHCPTVQKALGLRTSHVPNFYGCCCRFWTAILTHGFNRSAGLPYSGLHNTKCWCHIIRFYTKCDPLCAGIRQWTKNLCILNKTAIAVFSSLLASILSICQLQHLDTSPDSKATLYACAKKICMSSLENFGLRTGSCMTFPSFVFSFLKSRKRKRKTRLSVKIRNIPGNPEGLATMCICRHDCWSMHAYTNKFDQFSFKQITKTTQITHA